MKVHYIPGDNMIQIQFLTFFYSNNYLLKKWVEGTRRVPWKNIQKNLISQNFNRQTFHGSL